MDFQVQVYTDDLVDACKENIAINFPDVSEEYNALNLKEYTCYETGEVKKLETRRI